MSNNERLLKRVVLTDKHKPTGNTRHYIRGELVTTFHHLRIVEHAGEILLFYCDADGIEVTDTWHETIGQAMRQAEFKFGVRPDEWFDVV